jgi:molybdopterin-binding protein
MAKYQVKQIVQCDVNVWYTIEAENKQEAENIVKTIVTPTCVDGVDYEITNDVAILMTKIEEIN